jgi:RES domain-containing protein
VVKAWRIIKQRYRRDAFTGKGAETYGGRWNSPGHAVIYTAGTFSGALLEILAHSDRRLLPRYLIYGLLIPDDIISAVGINDLPRNWRTAPAPTGLQEIGDRWVEDNAFAVLEVPNAIAPMECNYLINPQHKQYESITIGDPIKYTSDARFVV